MLGLLSRLTPPSASPDCNLAYYCVNNRVVSARYRRTFCIVQKSFRLDGVAKVGSDMYRAQLRHMLEKATESPEK